MLRQLWTAFSVVHPRGGIMTYSTLTSMQQQIQVHQTTRSYRMLWLPAKNGAFSIKSAYRLLTGTTNTEIEILSRLEWKAFWRLQIHNKHKLLLWKFLWNALPIATRIATAISHTSNNHLDELCPRFNIGNEDAHHWLPSCDLVKKLWRTSPWLIQLENLQHLGTTGWIKSIIDPVAILYIPTWLPQISALCRCYVWPHLDDKKRLLEKWERFWSLFSICDY